MIDTRKWLVKCASDAQVQTMCVRFGIIYAQMEIPR